MTTLATLDSDYRDACDAVYAQFTAQGRALVEPMLPLLASYFGAIYVDSVLELLRVEFDHIEQESTFRFAWYESGRERTRALTGRKLAQILAQLGHEM